MRPIFGLAIAFATVGSVNTAMAADLIKNGSFEKPPPPPGSYTVYDIGKRIGAWTVVGSSGNVATVSTSFVENGVTLDAHKGQAFMDLTGVCDCGAPSGVAQTVATTPGVTYKLRFWLGNPYIPSRAKKSTMKVYVGSTLLITATNGRGKGSTKQIWKKFATTFVAEGTSTTLSFINGDQNGDPSCNLDSVSLIAD
jgi:hypothetical protein